MGDGGLSPTPPFVLRCCNVAVGIESNSPAACNSVCRGALNRFGENFYDLIIITVGCKSDSFAFARTLLLGR